MSLRSKRGKADCVIGLQWGDEGKGKIVDFLSEKRDLVVRYQGGSNAGHTVMANGEEFIFHLIPTGILHRNVKCVIGQGVVFDPEKFFEEVEVLRSHGVRIEGRLFVSRRVHVVFPYHKALDSLRERHAGEKKIGTTSLGIGPAYSDKSARLGIRLCDLIDRTTFEVLLAQNLKEKNALIRSAYKGRGFSFKELYERYADYGKRLVPFLCDCGEIVRDALKKGKKVLFEGAQGTLLDIDNGTYPFVTSSSTGVDGIASGAGVSPQVIGRVFGVLKAYATRVGGGPHPTEESGEVGNLLRERGGEYGATTGRPRRCGWLDCVSAKYAADLNDVDSLIITKLDVLTGLKRLKVAVAYRIGSKEVREFPCQVSALWKAKPVYIEVPGWSEEIGGARRFSQLPKNARNYIRLIEKLVGRPVSIISVGSSREQVIGR
jgi:adenylosuccinate synthase